MDDLSFLPLAAQQRKKSVSDAMGAMGLGHLARLHGQLEGYALLLVDLEQISVEQSMSLQATAEELFIRWRAHYLSRPQKPRSKMPKRPVISQLLHKAASRSIPWWQIIVAMCFIGISRWFLIWTRNSCRRA